MNKINILDEVITLTAKKITLLKEYKASILAENADYIIDQVKIPRGTSNDYDHWYCIDKNSGIIKIKGSKAQIQKYLDKRKITKVYWRHLT